MKLTEWLERRQATRRQQKQHDGWLTALRYRGHVGAIPGRCSVCGRPARTPQVRRCAEHPA